MKKSKDDWIKLIIKILAALKKSLRHLQTKRKGKKEGFTERRKERDFESLREKFIPVVCRSPEYPPLLLHPSSCIQYRSSSSPSLP
jgi:hypothetical protein